MAQTDPLQNLSYEKKQALAAIAEEVEPSDVDRIANQTGMSRRQVMQAAMALLAGGAIGGLTVQEFIAEVRAAASTSDNDGNVGLPSDPVDVYADGVDASSVSTEKIDTDAGGNGYTWSDESSSRSFSTWYQAPTDRDIWFAVVGSAASDNTEIQLDFHINTSQSDNRIHVVRDIVDTGGRIGGGSFRVPAGQHYKVENYRDTGSYSMNPWSELR